jgi:hypothetical protein
MENKIPMTKRGERYLARIESLEKQFAELVRTEAEARKELEFRFAQALASQREEITHLREELIRERHDKQIRTSRALKKFKSE